MLTRRSMALVVVALLTVTGCKGCGGDDSSGPPGAGTQTARS